MQHANFHILQHTCTCSRHVGYQKYSIKYTMHFRKFKMACLKRGFQLNVPLFTCAIEPYLLRAVTLLEGLWKPF